jgi:hypothetical protein
LKSKGKSLYAILEENKELGSETIDKINIKDTLKIIEDKDGFKLVSTCLNWMLGRLL